MQCPVLTLPYCGDITPIPSSTARLCTQRHHASGAVADHSDGLVAELVEQSAEVADPLAEKRAAEPEGPLSAVVVRRTANGVPRVGVLTGGAQAERKYSVAGSLKGGEFVFGEFHFAFNVQENDFVFFAWSFAECFGGSEANARLGREIDATRGCLGAILEQPRRARFGVAEHVHVQRVANFVEVVGPVGLLEGKKAFVIVTSGGTELGSDIDFVSAWMKHVLGFIGITDVTMIDSSGLMKDEAGAIARAEEEIATA